ncbi:MULTISPECIES: DUF4383 domain-containing protein [Fictibacillus]|uniref:DUF4383 domain-containing protein n=1 Tax=Fictibacillus TaxID=1329200 RepID=UPI001029F4F7|nr:MULTISPECIES: DUF4383 domain-containing protein [Fictibacillus]RZT21915.1 uncharacterized protein DUF4383 [Fictibacillus sp. BK138]
MASKFVKVLGIVFLILGVIGFVFPMEGLFHLTPIHNVIHIVSGIVALVMSSSEAKSILYAKIFGGVYLLVAILGLFTHEFAGIMFMIATNILHFAIAFSSIYVGFRSNASAAAGHTASR